MNLMAAGWRYLSFSADTIAPGMPIGSRILATVRRLSVTMA
jgi:hypothetical protein